MNTARKQQHDWNGRLQTFNREHLGRATRLGVFEPSESGMNDYWLENGLAFRGVTIEQHDGKLVTDLLLDGFTHSVKNAGKIELIYGMNEGEDGLNVVDSEGKTSVLRFESDRSEV